MRRLCTLACSVAMLVATFPRGAGAQDSSDPVILEPPRHRQGYYMSLGQHALIAQSWDHGESLGAWTGAATTIRLGQLLTRRFGLGLQIDFGAASKGTETAAIFGLSLAGQWELFRHFAIHAGSGLGVVNITDSREPDADLRGTFGAGYFVGASYDWFPWKRRLTGGFALTPLAQARVIPGSTVDSLVFLIGLEVGWWTGLPRNQLDLPVSEAYKKE